jgi:protein TonB
MEEKKTANADLEYGRTTFLLLGFVVALSTFFVVLEWSNEETLSPDWAGFSPLFIEAETPGLATPPEEVAPSKSVEVKEIKPVTLADEFNVVEKAGTEEIPVEKEEEKEKDIPSNTEETVAIHTEAEIMPQFKGGYAELARFIYQHLQYPEIALQKRIQGRIWYSFTVNKDGSVSNIQLEKGISLYLDDEALRVLKMMPPWEPGTTNGDPVRVKVYLPIVFKL